MTAGMLRTLAWTSLLIASACGSSALAAQQTATDGNPTGPTGPPGETGWVSDVLTVPLRSGPSNAHRIVHRGLPSGTQLKILEVDEEAGFTHIITQRGTEGWLRSQYVVREPIARDRLKIAQQRIARLEQQLTEQKKKLAEVSGENQSQSASNKTLSRQVKTLQTELAEIKRVSAGAIQEHEHNQQLEALNQRLRAEVEDLTLQNQRAEKNARQNWMLLGGGLVLGGLLLGMMLKSRPRRSGWS